MGDSLGPRILLALGLTAGALGALALAGVASPEARATTEIDRRYSLDTIGALRSWDNVDGLFTDYVNAAYKDYFSRQGRFRLVDLSKADAAFAQSKLPYAKAIEDPEVLGSLARSLRAQSLLRTRIRKEGPQYRFTVDWLHSPGMDVLASESFVVTDLALGDVGSALRPALDSLFRKVPFIGQVSGRDGDSVTLGIGASSGVRKGDTLLVGTLDDVKKHPLLKQVVDWRITPTGRVEVDQVDESIAFGRVTGEEEGRQVARYQKIYQVIPKPVAVEKARDPDAPDSPEEPPRLGFVRGSLWTGGFSRQYTSSASGTEGKSGSGMLFGARGDGQLWFDRSIFADLELGYGGFGYSQQPLNSSGTGSSSSTSSPSVNGSVFTFKLDAGYSLLLSGDFFGPKGWIKAGFLSTSYSLPLSTAESTAPFSEKSFFVGLGGDIPVRDGFGARLDLEFGLFNSASEGGSAQSKVESEQGARIYVGGYYRYQPRLMFQAGFELQNASADLAGGGGISHRTITFLPSVAFFF